MPHGRAIFSALKSALPLLFALAACPAPGGPPAPTHGTRLVVLMVIDQLPEWAFEAKRPALHGGFERLLSDGAWHVGRHPSAATLTAPGHALLGTGAPPARSGILANEWWHRDLHRSLAAVESADGATDASWLRVPGLGDAIAAAGHGAKAVSVSLKARAALLPLGHAGTAIWLDTKTATWTSSTAPAWLAAWNESHPVSAHLHDVWTPLDAKQLAELAHVEDAQPGEVGVNGFGPTFPHDLGATTDPGKAIEATPVGNDIELDIATEAIQREQLGADDMPDILVISLSPNDLIAHGWGQESWEAWDMMLRLDQRLAQFLADLDRLVGAGRWAMILTSDHGASPMPETLHGGRLTFDQVKVAANNAAAAVLGPGEWVDNAHYPNVFFSAAMLAQPKDELASATKRVLNALRSFPGIERVGRVADFLGNCDARKPQDRALCLTFDAERSGDLFYLPANGWILQDDDEPLATAHGSMHDYDRLVPVIELAPGHTTHAAATAPGGAEVPMTEIAATLAHWAGIRAPAELSAASDRR